MPQTRGLEPYAIRAALENDTPGARCLATLALRHRRGDGAKRLAAAAVAEEEKQVALV